MNLFRSKAQKRWIYSLLLLVGLLLLAVTLLTTWMLNSFTKEITQLNYNLTSFVQESIDTRLKEIENISLQIELSAANLTLSKINSIDDVSDSLVYQFSNWVRNYKLANTFIEDIYIYYPAIDYIIGDIGKYKTKNYYLLYNDLKLDDFDEWMNNITSRNHTNYYFNQNELMFSRQLPYNEFAEGTAYIVIKINRNEILKTLESTKTNNTDAMLAMLNSDGVVYASAKERAEGLLDTFPESALSSEKEINIYDNYYILKRDSTVSQMKYVTVLDRASLLAAANHKRNIAYIVLLGCLLGGIILSYYVSKINNRPLQSIVNKVIGGRMPNSTTQPIDEFNLLDQKIDDILSESAKSNLRLEEQQEKIESLFLSSVLSSELRDDRSIFVSMQRLDLQFLHPQLVIMLIRTFNKEDTAEMNARIQNAVGQLHNNDLGYDFISAEYRGDIVVLLNVEHEVSLQMLETMAKEFHQQLSFVDCLIALGGMYDSLSDIIVSYQQARQIADSTQEGQAGVFVYQVKSINLVNEQTDGSHLMVEFNRVMDGQSYSEAQKLIDPLFNQYVVPEVDAYLFRCKKYAVIHRIMDAAVAMQKNNIDVRNCIELLSNSKTIAELKESTYEVLGKLAEVYEQTALPQSDSIAKRAWDIIESGYTDPMIGLYSISEQLGVTNSYLSKVFKDTYGIGIIQHINQRRIEKAKTYILTTSLQVKEIAERIGFSSDVSFIRVFKQYTNVTPGKFKEMNGK